MGLHHIEKWWYSFFCWFFQISSWVCVIAYTIHFTFPENKLIADEYIDDEEVR